MLGEEVVLLQARVWRRKFSAVTPAQGTGPRFPCFAFSYSVGTNTLIWERIVHFPSIRTGRWGGGRGVYPGGSEQSFFPLGTKVLV